MNRQSASKTRFFQQSLRLLCPSLPGRPTVAPASVGVGRPECASGVLFFKDAHPRLRLDRFFWVVGGGGLTQAIDAATEKLAAVGSRLNAPASSLPACAGECRLPGISLRSTRRTLTVFRPSTQAAPRPGSRQSAPCRLRLQTAHCLPPRPLRRSPGSALRFRLPCYRAELARASASGAVAASGTFSTPDRYSTCPAVSSGGESNYGFGESQNKFGKLVRLGNQQGWLSDRRGLGRRSNRVWCSIQPCLVAETANRVPLRAMNGPEAGREPEYRAHERSKRP